MKASRFPLIALGSLLPVLAARADLQSGLIAYYNFEADGSAGIANQIGAAATHNGTYGSGTTYDVTPPTGAGAGFAGDPAYAGAEIDNTTDRSVMLVGKALNIEKSDASATAGSGWFNVPTLNATTLGSNFTISAWFYLAPDADNTGTDASILRDYVFETADTDTYDVSFGTNDANGSTYVSWLGSTSGPNNAGTLGSGQWNHVAHVFSQDGANTTLSVYINGVKVGATVSTATANMNFTSLNFGAARTGYRVFDGMMDEVAVWNRSLTPSEVLEVQQRGNASLALTADLAAAGKAFVAVEPSDPVMGRTYGAGLYNLNEQAFIEAEPAIGHLFTSWAAPYSSQPDIFTHTVTASVTFTAGFARDTADDDGDGLTNYDELVIHHTYPDDADSDDDQINDRAEVQQTQTNPMVSQLAAVNYIIANLGGGASPGDTVLTRNQTNNTLTLKLSAKASTTLGGWSPIVSPEVTASQSDGDFLLQIPATSDTERFFQIQGWEP